MRSTNKTIVKRELVDVEYVVTSESILSINENKVSKDIVVEVGLQNDDKIVSTEVHYITDSKYDLLMSASPNFATGKPVNEYREVDLWYIIDLLRNV